MASNGSGSAPPEGAWSRRFKTGFTKSIQISDWASTHANAVSARVGGERFWPKSDDMPLEIEKCERILRSFTVEGIPQKEEREERVQDGKGNWITKKRKVLRKIPPSAIKNAKGVCIYSSMRSGIAPFGGGGGAGLVLARLEDGSWSAPSAVSPNNMSAGLLFGVDFIDAILLINSEKALQSFMSHKFTIGAETGLTAGPFGTGASAESGFERSPIYSYVRTRGAYAGVEIMGQVFLHRFDENERFYYWPGIKAEEILSGKVRMPPLVSPLHRALRDAEMGVAQGGKLERVMYDVVKMPESEVMKMLGPKQAKSSKRFVANSSIATTPPQSPAMEASEQVEGTEESPEEGEDERPKKAREEGDEDEDDFVREGEKLKLPPTPQELDMLEQAGIPDEEDLKFAQEERIKVYQLPPPPMHIQVKRYWRVRPELAAKRPTKQLVMDGPHCPEVREAQFVMLPPSPRSSIELLEEAKEEERKRTEEGEGAEKQGESDIRVDSLPEEGVLLHQVEEEEADDLMKAAAEGQDVQELEENGEIDDLEAKGKISGADEPVPLDDAGAGAGETAEKGDDSIRGEDEARAGDGEGRQVIVGEDASPEEGESKAGIDVTSAGGAEAEVEGAKSANDDNHSGAPGEERFSSPRASLDLSSSEQAADRNSSSPQLSQSEDAASAGKGDGGDKAAKRDRLAPGRPPRSRPPRRKKT